MKNITIKDVAKECGVSTQTVSRVINESRNVSEKTRKIVEDKIKKLGYKPNLYAKNLSKRRMKNILVSVRRNKGHTATIWANILVSEIFACNKNKNVSIFMEQYYDERELSNSLLNTSNTFIDGVIIFYEKKNDKRVSILKKENIPFIVVGKSYSDENIYVSNDDFNSVFKATEYLFKKEIEKITFITANPTPMNLERKNGIIEAYKKNNKSIENLIIAEKMNNEKWFRANEALEAGFIDEIVENDNSLENIKNISNELHIENFINQDLLKEKLKEIENMKKTGGINMEKTIQELINEHPKLMNDYKNQIINEIGNSEKEKIEAAIKAERERIQALDKIPTLNDSQKETINKAKFEEPREPKDIMAEFFVSNANKAN